MKYVVSAKVRYVTDNTTMDIADVQCGDTLKEPDNPQKDGYKFIGWQDEETGKFWDFKDAVERNMTLIAKFEKISDKVPDKEEITSPETKKIQKQSNQTSIQVFRLTMPCLLWKSV